MLPQRLLALTALCLIASAAQAAVTLEGIRPGAHVNGPKFDAADLKGRVVLVEYWGVNCPPCLASIPHISELQEKYGRDQFVIIANQCQDADEAKAKSVFKGRGGSDMITVINRGDLSGANVSGIPHCFLFNHEGKRRGSGRFRTGNRRTLRHGAALPHRSPRRDRASGRCARQRCPTRAG